MGIETGALNSKNYIYNVLENVRSAIYLALNINQYYPGTEEPITFPYIPKPLVSSVATESSRRSSACTATSTLPGKKKSIMEGPTGIVFPTHMFHRKSPSGPKENSQPYSYFYRKSIFSDFCLPNLSR